MKQTYCIICQEDGEECEWINTKHEFPKSPQLRSKWISLLNLEDVRLKARSRVCSKHFSKNQYHRFHLKSTAVPMKRVRETKLNVKTEKDLNTTDFKSVNDSASTMPGSSFNDFTSKEQDFNSSVDPLKGKINLADHCVFCLEKLHDADKEHQTFSNAPLESLADFWPYLFLKETGGGTVGAPNYKFLRGKDKEGEPVFSNIPPMCSLCNQDFNVFYDLCKGLEEIKKKLVEQESLVNNAVMKIRKSIDISSKSRTLFVNSVLSSTNVSPSCLSSTTQFLNHLSKSTVIPIAPNPITVISNPIAIIPTMTIDTTSQNQQLLVLDTIGQAFCQQQPIITKTTTVQTAKQTAKQTAYSGCVQKSLKEENNVLKNTPIIVKVHSTSYTHAKPQQPNKLPSSSDSFHNSVGHQKQSQHLQKRECIVNVSYSSQSKRSRLTNAVVLNKNFDISIPNVKSEYFSDDEELIDVPETSTLQYSEFNDAEEDDDDDDNDDAGIDDPLA